MMAMKETDACELLCLELEVARRIRKEVIPGTPAEAMSAKAYALADPNRLRIASALGAAPELCVCDLAWICARPQNLVSHHLRVLHGQDLVSRRRQGKMVMYALTEEGRRLLEALALEKAVIT